MITMTGYDRAFQVPRYIQDSARLSGIDSPLTSGRVTAWELLSEDLPAVATDWADRIISSVIASADAPGATALDCAECTDTGFYGITDLWDDDILRGLVRRNGDSFQRLAASGSWDDWKPCSIPLETLDYDIAQDLANALLAGANGLVRRFYMPIAFLPPAALIAATPVDMTDIQPDPAVPAPDAAPGIPADGEGWHTYAIVDELDTGAVLNMVRLKEGPELERFDPNGTWQPDSGLMTQMLSVKPPSLVELTTDQIDSVKKQVQATAAQDAKGGAVAAAGLDTKSRAKAADKGTALPDGSFPIRNRGELGKAVKALGRAKNQAAAKRHIIKRARALNAVGSLPEAWGIKASAGALVADAPLHVSPNGGAEKLRRYWSIGGKGGLKIRWGTPGDWKRCYKHLSKYMGLRAKGYCANMHKRNTGMWTGSKLNASGSIISMMEAIEAQGGLTWTPRDNMSTSGTVASGRRNPERAQQMVMKDGIYREREGITVLKSVTAGAFPVNPPDEFFENPNFDRLTGLTVEDDGHVYGHLADFDMPHIGLPGSIRPPRSRTDYAYFKTGSVLTATGKKVRVGNLTLVGGHAPLEASAKEAVKHYDDTESAVADVNVGEDRYGIWFSGSLRPTVTPEQVRAFMASALSGDWRPINGALEMVACCSVNVPGFPIAEARVASGAVMALVAAGARGVALRQASVLADAAVLERLEGLESMLYAPDNEDEDEEDLGAEDETVLEEGEEPDEVEGEGEGEGEADEEEGEPEAEGDVEDVNAALALEESIARAREKVAARKAAQIDPVAEADEAAARRAELRARVHKTSVA